MHPGGAKTPFMASPARCLALQQALALLKGASNAEVEHVGGAYGVIRPLQQLRAGPVGHRPLVRVLSCANIELPSSCATRRRLLRPCTDGAAAW